MTEPILILAGEESYLMGRELSSLRKKTLDPTMADFNHDKFTAGDTPVARILDVCAQFPMMSEVRLVEISDADRLLKHDLEALIPYFENPNPSTQLVLTASKIDKRLKLWSMASKKGWVREFKPLYENQLPAWLEKEVSGKGLKISPDACLAMVDAIGNSLSALVSALETIELYITPRKDIGLKDVEAIAGDFLAKSVFNLASCVGGRKLAEASDLMNQMMTKGEPPVRILHLLVRHFRILFVARECLDEGKGEKDIAVKAGVSPFFIKEYLDQAKKINQKGLRTIFGWLLSADKKLKGSPLAPRLVLDDLLIKLSMELN